MIKDKAEVAFEGQTRDAAVGHYPMFDLNGADIAIVDEPLQNRELVGRLSGRSRRSASSSSTP
ncbi:hypothetical protein [Burkholderia gladioli]|uniref:hypothetical protein n=1 Tax=Burkholderia gladioli TaxID=28095 RepID=UPI000FD7607E|nr:hypothetical protein [Burkholderia gladioli]